VTTETRHEREVKFELVLQPLDGGGAVVGEHTDEWRTCESARRIGSVFIEFLGRVL
jgi:hypothetical protein